MLNPYLGVGILFIVFAGFIVTMLILSSVLGPKNPTKTKQMPFECGVNNTGVRNQRFNVKFYLVAMLFILFDVEVIFMYPWAVLLPELGWFGFFEMCTFMLVLAGGLVYVWRRGALDWN